jgi:hypothetical protein
MRAKFADVHWESPRPKSPSLPNPGIAPCCAGTSDDAARAPELPQTNGLPDRPEYPHPLGPQQILPRREARREPNI